MRGPVRPRTVEDNETLLAAGEAGDADAVRALLGTGVAPAIACKDAALLAAAFTGHAACARALLDAGTSAGAERDGDTALMVAGIVGHAECLRALVAPGARVDDGGCGSDAALILASHVGHANGTTALIMATADGHAGCVRTLLAAGANSNLSNATGETALGVAAANAHIECARALLGGGAVVRERESLVALHHVETLPAERGRALLVVGADVHATDGASGDALTPLALARAVLATCGGGSGAREGAALIVDVAAPWSPAAHALFAAPARARAVQLCLLGRLLSRERRFATVEMAACDVWPRVLAHAVRR
ncbi:hypothetical protein KFE25_004676 [Diacronema lutheri]|uniref:Ankyrin repeat protein n=1 Tax=Diacronema lutheri TaxID=2081491 RepID=A0A8J5XNW9_DIALT|nr:hypothetical protein KFE25_004676 [Diacronema lutheri]